MEKIKHYKLKDGVIKEQLIAQGFKEGGTWVHKQAVICLSKYVGIANTVDFKNKQGKIKHRKLTSAFNIDIAFTENIQDWNDFDNVLVLDSDFCQPYYPFYNYMNGEMKSSEVPKVLPLFVAEYNKYMDSLDFLEEVE